MHTTALCQWIGWAKSSSDKAEGASTSWHGSIGTAPSPCRYLQLMALGFFPSEGLALPAWLIHPAKDSNSNSQYLAPGVALLSFYCFFSLCCPLQRSWRGYFNHGGTLSGMQGAPAGWDVPHHPYLQNHFTSWRSGWGTGPLYDPTKSWLIQPSHLPSKHAIDTNIDIQVYTSILHISVLNILYAKSWAVRAKPNFWRDVFMATYWLEGNVTLYISFAKKLWDGDDTNILIFVFAWQ